MRWIYCTLVLLFVSSLYSGEAESLKQRAEKISSERTSAVEKWRSAVMAAKSAEERDALMKSVPDRHAFTEKLWALYNENPDDPESHFALIALIPLIDGAGRESAIEELVQRAAHKPEMSVIVFHISTSKEADKWLSLIEERNPDRDIKARALLARAEGRVDRVEFKNDKASEAIGIELFERAKRDYGAVPWHNATVSDHAARRIDYLKQIAASRRR